MIVKEIKQSEDTATKYYELYETEEITDVLGNIVTIPKLIEKTNLFTLTNRKEQLEAELVKVNEKITAINNLEV